VNNTLSSGKDGSGNQCLIICMVASLPKRV